MLSSRSLPVLVALSLSLTGCEIARLGTSAGDKGQRSDLNPVTFRKTGGAPPPPPPPRQLVWWIAVGLAPLCQGRCLYFANFP
jgi:hypothetical protein